MEELSSGPLVPAVKSELSKPLPSADAPSLSAADTFPFAMSEPDKDFLCPICMQLIKDAFLTSCGHSFCYMCIITHLRNKSDCPCCSHYLTNSHLFPNFLLDKLLKKTAARQISKTASPVEHFRQTLQKETISDLYLTW